MPRGARAKLKAVETQPDEIVEPVATDDWRDRHMSALRDPNENEQPLIGLLAVILECVDRGYGNDGVLRHYVAMLIIGAQGLLAGEWGDRLDKGQIDGLLGRVAEGINYDVATQEFTD